jgi:PAS domain-containing protein
MCPECDAWFGKLWAGMRLGEYLDGLPAPVMVVDTEGRVVAANGRMASALGHDARALRGLLGGEAMACVHSRLPEGCGKTEHCRECSIRRAVDRVIASGRAVSRVPAWVDTGAGRMALRISARPIGSAVEVTIDELRPP